MYEIRVDMENRVIDDTLFGYWDLATAKRFDEDYRAAIRKVAAAGPGWRIYGDHTRLEIQSPEVTAIIGSVIEYVREMGVAKVAAYMPHALGRMQMHRLEGDKQWFRMFASEEEARAWLAE